MRNKLEVRNASQTLVLFGHTYELVAAENYSPRRRQLRRWRLSAMAEDATAEAARLEVLEVDWWGVFDTAYDRQRDYCTGSVRMTQGFIGGRATGKSWVEMLKALWLALANPGRINAEGYVEFCPGAVLGRTMREVKDRLEPVFLGHVRKFKAATGISLIKSFNKASECYTLVNGSKIYLLSYGRMNTLKQLFGWTWAWCVIDEIEFAEVDSYTVYQKLIACLRHPLAAEPCFAFGTTPDGLRGLTAHCVKMQRAEDRETFIVTATVHNNPHVSDEFRDNLKRGCTEAMWRQEGLGQVLKPHNVIYPVWSDALHVIPWEWDPSLPFLMGADWGTSHAYCCFIQVITRDGHPSGRRPGDWILARERKCENTTVGKFRSVIKNEIERIGYQPYMTGSDRAKPSEVAWLCGQFKETNAQGGHLDFLQTRAPSRAWSIGAVAFMLEPMDEALPRLFVADSVPNTLDESGRGIRGAMLNYRYRTMRTQSGEVVVTNKPEENTPNAHPQDGLRYIVGVSVWDEFLHGGSALPYALAHDDDDGATRRVQDAA